MPVTRVVLEANFNTGQVTKGIGEVNAKFDQMGAAGYRAGVQASKGIDTISLSIRQVQSRLSSLQQVLGPLAEAITIGLTVPITLFAKAAFDAYKNLDNIQRGIAAVVGSQSEAIRQIANIRTIAKEPGLDFESAAGGFRRLVAAGLDIPLATAAIKEFGNALALVGGTSEDLAGVNLAIQQIASKTKVSAEEVNQIAERIPSVRRLIIQAYGTADTEELQRRGVRPMDFIRQIVEQAKTLPRATSGIANETKNFSDEIKRNLQTIGEDLSGILLPVMREMNVTVRQLGDGFRQLSPEIRRFIIVSSLLAAAMGPFLAILNGVRSALTAVVSGIRLLKEASAGAAGTASAAASVAAGPAKAVNPGILSMYGERAATSFLPPAAEVASVTRELTALRVGAASFIAIPLMATLSGIALAFKQIYESAKPLGGLGEVFRAIKKEGYEFVSSVIAPLTQFARESAIISGIGKIKDAYSDFISTVAEKARKYSPTLIVLQGLMDAGRRAVAREEGLTEAGGRNRRSVADAARQMAEGADPRLAQIRRAEEMMGSGDSALSARGSAMMRALQDEMDKAARKREQKQEEDRKVQEKRAELMRDLNDALVKQRTDTAIAGGDMGEFSAYYTRKIQERSSMRARNAGVWTGDAESIFNQTAAEGGKEIFLRQRNELYKERNKLALESIDLMGKEGKAARELYGEQYLETLKQSNEQERDRLNIASQRLQMLYDIDQRRADIDKTKAIGMAELGEGNDVRSKIATEEKKLAIEREYIDRSLQIQLKKIEAQYNAEIMMAEAKGERELAIDLRSKLSLAQYKLRTKSQLDAEEAITNARVRQYQIQRDEALKTFNSIKDGAGRVFDALLLKTESFGQALKNILKAALLTPLREFAATWTAMLLTGGAGANGRSAGGSSQQGLFNRIFGGFGGFGTGSTSGVGSGGYGGGYGGSSGGGLLGGLFGGIGGVRTPISTGINGGTIYSDGTSTMGGSAGGAGGFAGRLGLAGAGSSFKGLLSSLGNIGYGPKGGDFGGEVAGSYRGVGGVKGGAMLAGGAILAMDGLRRGGWAGVGETTAGGALIGGKFGGWTGAAIGAAIGFAAGIVRLFIKGATEKTVEKIKSYYGVTVSKDFASSAIVPIIKQQFGGNIDVGIRSPQVRELLELYAMSTGQPFANLMNPANPRPVSMSQSGGSLYTNPSIINGTTISNLGAISPSSSSSALVVKLDGPATTELLQGQAVQAVVENPRAVSEGLGSALLSSMGRRSLSASLTGSPGLVTA